jgi:hypothetical protein
MQTEPDFDLKRTRVPHLSNYLDTLFGLSFLRSTTSAIVRTTRIPIPNQLDLIESPYL